ncbi:DUF6241 domain-containing protein [Bacillus sp. RAR_GA_16]|uniref:DUF6241 domain-containing protein n=1 Tax=Bacillus sp. RAR_GA_16 TaxID=2876774 RepID=UPI001CCF3C8F|nr:DUF6241 domain-containing protein [Bacillus sp. RAR_GA_16]MCA0172167.1 DUF6241 domain-containing protein [Bacillus sp. RAR_GA_16]
MEDKLKNLRRDMDETVLKKGEVSEGEKERIYYRVMHKNNSKRAPKRFFPVLTTTLCMIVVWVLSSPYIYDYYYLSQEETEKIMGDIEGKKLDQKMPKGDSEINEEIMYKETEHFSKEIVIPPENEFMADIYHMTNQKVFVESDDFIEMPTEYIVVTDESIKTMLMILDKAKQENQYQNYEFYYNTLTEWEKGNFENAVDVHNQIREFNRRSGNKATRLLTKEEEKKYIEIHSN